MAGSQRRVKRTRRGDFQLRLPRSEREILRALPDQLRELLDSNDPAVARLFPPAYEDDPEENLEYEQLVREDLVAGRMKSIEVMEATIDAARVTRDELLAWLGSLNDLRLTLGTRLGVTEEMYANGAPDTDPEAHLYALYFYLGWLQEQVVEELTSEIDPAGSSS